MPTPGGFGTGGRGFGGRPGGTGRGAALVVVGVLVLLVVALLAVPLLFGGAGALFDFGNGCQHSQSGPAVAQPNASGAAKGAIPANYLALYQKVGKQYGVPWTVLAGIGTVESDNGQSNLPGVHSGTNSAGAAGPMQIGVGGASSDTWSTVKNSADGNGPPSVYDPADAITGAAKYLLRNGVQTNVSGAIFAYNHLPSYVQAVEQYASQYAGGHYTVTAATSGAAGGSMTCGQVTGASVGNAVVGGGTVPNQAVATAIAYAEQQVGKPYQWGGTGPDAYDCSGLVMMAYRTAGVAIPRTSGQQWARGPEVPASQVEPGDVVFFAGSDGAASNPGHEALVIGGGKMVEAYATGYPIRIASYGTASSPPGDQHPVGFTRPWSHRGLQLTARQAAAP